MKNLNNLITVNFPNGQSRTRNCQTTEMPDQRMAIPQRFLATGDFHTCFDQCKQHNRQLKLQVEGELLNQISAYHFWRVILAGATVFLFGILVSIIYYL